MNAFLGKSALIVLAATMLMSCSEEEMNGGYGSVACAQRALLELGLVKLNADGALEDTEEGHRIFESGEMDDTDGGEVSFRKTSSEDFVVELPAFRIPGRKPIKLTCIGNLATEELSSMQMDGRLLRPKAGETWPMNMETRKQNATELNQEQ